MTKNPIINAFVAIIYIVLVVFIINFTGKMNNGAGDPPFIPLAVISLFTLSAAVMGYIFLSEPLQLIIEGEKKKGINLFLQTVGAFAIFTIIAFVSVFYFRFGEKEKVKEEAGGGVICTADAKLCSDGVTYVGRTGPKCEFAKCPGE